MDEDEDLGRGAVFCEGADDGAVRDDVGLELARLDVEDEDKNGNGREDVRALVGEVVFDEAILSGRGTLAAMGGGLEGRRSKGQEGRRAGRLEDAPSAVPQVQHQVPHELDVAVLDINGGAQAAHVLGDIVAEDDGAHRRLAGAALAHEQHLALLLALARVHGGGACGVRGACGRER